MAGNLRERTYRIYEDLDDLSADVDRAMGRINGLNPPSRIPEDDAEYYFKSIVGAHKALERAYKELREAKMKMGHALSAIDPHYPD
jgi:hypothetical protein